MNVIYKTNPRHTEDNVKLDQVLEVIFMVDINQNTITPDTVILLNLKEQKVEPVSFTYARKVLKVTAENNLSADSHYQLQLVGGSQGIKDITGRIMAQTMDIEFTTRHSDTLKPPIIISPTDVSIIRQAATFKLEPLSEALYYELEISESNTFHNVLWPTQDEKIYHTQSLEITPDVPYKTGLYYMRVRSANSETDKSAWSESIRFFFDNSPPIEELVPEETVESIPQVAKQVVLQAASYRQESNRQEVDQLSQLQHALSTQGEEVVLNLHVKSSSIKDDSVNNNVAAFNNMIAGGNQRKIVVEFTEDIDQTTIDQYSAYILSERN